MVKNLKNNVFNVVYMRFNMLYDKFCANL